MGDKAEGINVDSERVAASIIVLEETVAAIRDFPEAIPAARKAFCLNACGQSLSMLGRHLDAARALALAHHYFLQEPPCVELISHLQACCVSRFLCGHSEEAVATLRYAIQNQCLIALAVGNTGRCAWALCETLAGILLLTGRGRESAKIAMPAVQVPPCDAYADTVFLVAIVLDQTNSEKKVRKVLRTLASWLEWQSDRPMRSGDGRTLIRDIFTQINHGKHAFSEWLKGRATMRLGGVPSSPPLPDPFVGIIDNKALKNLALSRACARCGEQGKPLLKCSQCKRIWYCASECQAQDWPKHRETCRSSLQAIQNLNQRPGPSL